MRKFLTLLFCFLLPNFLLRVVLKLLGHTIGKNSKIGFSIIYVDNLKIEENSKIGHFNVILNPSIELYKNSKIGYLNILKGPFCLNLREYAAIGNKNYFTRGNKGVSYGTSRLELGDWTKITVGHHLDLTRNIEFGKYSILAGINSQLWTHGYYHADTGISRARIDGDIKIGDNVYIGSGCIFNPGVTIGNAIHLGAGSVVSKDLTEPGMYVNQPLRYIDNNLDTVKSKLNRIEGHDLVEEVYEKPQK